MHPAYCICMADTVVIRLERETREKLKNLGKKGETYDDVINKLIKETDE